MQKVKFIYNPYSGENSIVSNIDKVIEIHQRYGYSIDPFRISFDYKLEDAFKDINDEYKYILVAGGDGTVDQVVNCMKSNNLNLPLGILPVGTANDFAKLIGMPQNIEESCIQILNSCPKKVDIGKMNDKYFLNVASTGLFTDISQKTDTNLKNTLGKLAYYVKGIEQLPKFRKLNINVKSNEMNYDGDMFLMLVFNGRTAGNLNLAYKSEIDDGLLDVIIIKAIMIKNILPLFIQIVKGEHLENGNGLIYFKTDKLHIECHEDIVTDIDGERGPDFPVTIECAKKELKLLGISHNEIISPSNK